MLKTLSIKNFAIIESSEISFASGLNIITGETGSGKSILLKALGGILGEKSNVDFIRKGCSSAELQAFFIIEKTSELYQQLKIEEMLHEDDDSYLFIRKIIKPEITKIWINGVSCSNSFLNKISKELVQVLAQHQQQKIINSSEQLKLIDLSIDTALKLKLQEQVQDLKNIEKEIYSLEKDSLYKEERLSYLNHLLKDFESFDLNSSDDDLEDKIRLIENSQFILEELSGLEDLLYNDGLVDKMASLRKKIIRITQKVPNESLTTAIDKCDSLLKELDDLGEVFSNNKNQVNIDPEELPELLGKAKIIKKLKIKYGSIEQIKEQIQKLENEKSYLEGLDNDLKTKNIQKNKRLKEALTLAEQISSLRKSVAKKIENEISEELQNLNMQGAKIKIEFVKQDLSELGCDKVNFLISSNKGEDFKILSQIASGGELSRIMLAIHKCMNKDVNNCFLLDEVDQGISGNTGTIIGKKLAELSQQNQVIAITHLPQVALFADKHFFIEKKEVANSGRIVSFARELNAEEKEIELARMLGHSLNEESSINHARELIKAKNKPIKPQ